MVSISCMWNAGLPAGTEKCLLWKEDYPGLQKSEEAILQESKEGKLHQNSSDQMQKGPCSELRGQTSEELQDCPEGQMHREDRKRRFHPCFILKAVAGMLELDFMTASVPNL